nr:SUMF1/EgtB/PvdO family nonheme iron enzyme [Paraflavitalea speifideiaquila]
MKRLVLFFMGATAISVSSAQQTANFEPYETTIPGSAISFKMLPIPEGQFLMGSPAKEPGRKGDEGPQKNVKLSAFWMGRYEVTYDEFLLFFNDESTSRNSEVDVVTRPTPQYIDLSWGMGKQGGFPVNSMSQRTALMYCRWLYKKTGVFYRLPTEAEWEYACRAGNSAAYYFGNDGKLLKDYGWFSVNSKAKYQKVGQKSPIAGGCMI